MNVAEYILKVMQSLGTKHMFGVPGGAIEPMYDACWESQQFDGITSILTRSEAGAAFAADGYYRESNTPALVVSTTGPGATNLITGIASAKTERIPVMVITAQTNIGKFGKSALQESSDCGIDITGMFKSVTNLSTTITHIDQVYTKVQLAVNKMFDTVQGPVHLSIPTDILKQQLPDDYPLVHATKMCEHEITASIDSLKYINQRLENSQSPLLYFGEFTEFNSATFSEIANQLGIPYVTGSSSKGWYPSDDLCNFGVFGFAGHDSATRVIEQSDLIIMIGTSLQEMASCNWSDKIINEKTIHIANSTADMTMTGTCKQIVMGQKSMIEILSNLNKNFELPEQFESEICNDPLIKNSRVNPLKLMAELHKILPERSNVYLDAGNTWAWSINQLQVNNTISAHRIAMAFGSMAWAISAAVGASTVSNKPIVCITGDGSWLMSSNELSTAVANNLPIIYIILNDSQLGMVKHGQRKNGAKDIANALPHTQFTMMANAQGALAFSVGSEAGIVEENIEGFDDSTMNMLKQLTTQCVADKIPLVLEFITDHTIVPPMSVRCESLSVK